MKKDRNSVLPVGAKRYLSEIKTADIMVGIPSYNSAHTINYVVYQAAKGLDRYFPDLQSVVFVSDGKSTDGTLAAVKAMRLTVRAPLIPVTYLGPPGKGSAIKAIFEAAKLLGVKAVALVDSDLRSITPEWIKLLISPTLAGTGLVTPLYVRHKYDATITNFLCYPITSSLYGRKVRQPIGGDFGISMRLAKELLESELWHHPCISGFGIDIFETHIALAKGFDVKQAFLGIKAHEAKDPAKHLNYMFRQVVGSMFICIRHYEKAWKSVHGIHNVETVNEKKPVGEPEPVNVDLCHAMRIFRSDFGKYRKIYQAILGDDMLREACKLEKTDDMHFSFPPEIWAKMVYQFLARFKTLERLEEKEMLEALRILWIGRVTSFIKETSKMDTLKAEKTIEEQVKYFRELRTYLLDIF